MTRPLRMFEPERAYFVTNRTFQGRPFMTPSPAINDIIGSTLARAIRKHDVQVYGFVFMPTHFHLLLSGEAEQIARFMQYLQSVIARRINPVHSWRGAFFERRYSAESIEDNDALLGRLRYILSHGVKENLVARCADWPGVNSIASICSGEPAVYQWRNFLGNTTEMLHLTPLPLWSDVSQEVRARLVTAMMQEIDAAAAHERQETSSRPLGMARPNEHNLRERPLALKRTPRPLCHASTASAFTKFRRRLAEFLAAYRVASACFRAGFWDTPFPDHAFRPLGISLPVALGTRAAAVSVCG